MKSDEADIMNGLSPGFLIRCQRGHPGKQHSNGSNHKQSLERAEFMRVDHFSGE